MVAVTRVARYVNFLAPFQPSRSYIRTGGWAFDQAIANLIPPCLHNALAVRSCRGVRIPGTTNPGPIMAAPNIRCCIGILSLRNGYTTIFNRSTRRFGHQRVSRQPMGRFALCAVWSGWSCHRSCKLTIPPICPSNRTLLGVSAQTSIYMLPSVNHGDIDDPLRVLYSGVLLIYHTTSPTLEK